MAHLFSPLTVGNKRLSNRIVMAPYPSGHTAQDGFVSDEFYRYYLQRAHGNVGLIVTEPAQVLAPIPEGTQRHLGIYDDTFVPGIRRLAQAVHGSGAQFYMLLDAPGYLAQQSTTAQLQQLVRSFMRAAWRALAADCDGIILSAADGGVLHALTSPLSNRRTDQYGGSLTNRLRLPLEIIEGIRNWLGTHVLIGFRLIAEEFAPEGITLQDARVNARRLAAAGIRLIDVTTDSSDRAPVAYFPGWRVPLAERIKQVVPDIPVIGSGSLGDPHLADSVIRDGSVDLVMLGRALRDNPYWAHIARIVLASDTVAAL